MEKTKGFLCYLDSLQKESQGPFLSEFTNSTTQIAYVNSHGRQMDTIKFRPLFKHAGQPLLGQGQMHLKLPKQNYSGNAIHCRHLPKSTFQGEDIRWAVSPIHFHYLTWEYVPRVGRMENKVTRLEQEGACIFCSQAVLQYRVSWAGLNAGSGRGRPHSLGAQVPSGPANSLSSLWYLP